MSTTTALTPAEVLALPAMPSVRQAFDALNIGKNAGYQLIRDGQFPIDVVRLGTNLRVRRADLLALLGLQDEDPAGDSADDAPA